MCRYFLYKLVAQMHVFSQYRIWKAFRTWKRHLQRRKCTTVSCNLQDRLFILDGDYCGSVLLAVADRCEQLCCSLSLQALVPQQIGTLEDLKVSTSTLNSLCMSCTLVLCSQSPAACFVRTAHSPAYPVSKPERPKKGRSPSRMADRDL